MIDCIQFCPFSSNNTAYAYAYLVYEETLISPSIAKRYIEPIAFSDAIKYR